MDDVTFATTSTASGSRIDFAVLSKLMERLPKPELPKVAYVNPKNLEHFRQHPVAMAMVESELVPEFGEPVWQPDSWGPFASLEKSDEAWARPMGLGRMVDMKQRVAYLVDQSMLKIEMEMMKPRPVVGMVPPWKPQMSTLLAGTT